MSCRPLVLGDGWGPQARSGSRPDLGGGWGQLRSRQCLAVALLGLRLRRLGALLTSKACPCRNFCMGLPNHRDASNLDHTQIKSVCKMGPNDILRLAPDLVCMMSPLSSATCS